MLNEIIERPRRLRKNALLRELVAENEVRLSHLIQPYFVTDTSDAKQPISGFTSVFRWGVETLSTQIETDIERGVKSFMLFGDAPHDRKDAQGSWAYDEKSAVPVALQTLKRRFGESALWMTDICLCPYSSHGHCGVLEGREVLNDPSLELLCKMATLHAEVGADLVAPSDMMDGRVGRIRSALDQKGFANVAILAYTAKYASSYYGPFREAVNSSPQQLMDRCSYQMDYRNATDAVREARLDIAEGADLIMVKPALAYLDIVALLRGLSDVPVVAYSVSGEYEMVKQLARAGMAEERKLTLENWTAIRRAGANCIITYSASEAAEKGWLK